MSVDVSQSWMYPKPVAMSVNVSQASSYEQFLWVIVRRIAKHPLELGKPPSSNAISGPLLRREYRGMGVVDIKM